MHMRNTRKEPRYRKADTARVRHQRISGFTRLAWRPSDLHACMYALVIYASAAGDPNATALCMRNCNASR